VGLEGTTPYKVIWASAGGAARGLTSQEEANSVYTHLHGSVHGSIRAVCGSALGSVMGFRLITTKEWNTQWCSSGSLII
jgi:hypothetical protein